MADGYEKMFALDKVARARLKEEAKALAASGDFKALLSWIALYFGKKGFFIFNNQKFPMKADIVREVRPFAFAISLTNLMPLKRKEFTIKPGLLAKVKGTRCDIFLVHHPHGPPMRFFFAKDSRLLMKVVFRGLSRDRTGNKKEGRWEVFLSDYKEVDGIKQWHQAEIFFDGQENLTYRVTGVQFFNEMIGELRLPGKVTKKSRKPDLFLSSSRHRSQRAVATGTHPTIRRGNSFRKLKSNWIAIGLASVPPKTKAAEKRRTPKAPAGEPVTFW